MEYAALADVTKRDHFTFGGGRRICPGSWVAERSMFLNLARLLWGFNIKHAKDENGNIIPVDFTTDGLVPGALSNAKPFACCMFPSSPPFPPFRCPGGCFLFFGCGMEADWCSDYCEESETGECVEEGMG